MNYNFKINIVIFSSANMVSLYIGFISGKQKA